MKHWWLVICLLCVIDLNAQHNSTYSQYMFNGLLLNPAYAGSHDALNLTALYRKQWLGMDGAPTNINFTAHMPFKKRKAGLGLVVMNDKFGVSDYTKLNFNYSYRIKMTNGQLCLGLLAGIDMRQNNWNQVKTTQNRDPSFVGNAERKISPQVGTGVYYYNKNLYVGVSAPALLDAAMQQNKYQLIMFNTGCVLNVSGSFKIKPAVLVKYLLNSPVDANLSTTFYWKDYLGLGAGYSMNKTGFAYTDIKINDQFRLGYAYDYSFSALNTYSAGSHEVMLRYLFQYKIQVPSIRYF